MEGAPDLSYVKALIVDDFQPTLDLTASMLRKYKMLVDCVSSGQEAVNLVKNGEPEYNLIFMDYMMPEMDGIEAVRQIRAIGTEYAKNLPVIALTGDETDSDGQMFLNSGFQLVLAKPISFEILNKFIKDWLIKNITKINDASSSL
ncbi:MAG: response regulator [Treponema sp.]|nr:response regulator [Treponema sp.]